MKLKILVITMILTMCLALCACGGGTAATITDNEGNVVQMTAKELKTFIKKMRQSLMTFIRVQISNLQIPSKVFLQILLN